MSYTRDSLSLCKTNGIRHPRKSTFRSARHREGTTTGINNISLLSHIMYILQGNTRYPFNEIIYANIGDCQAMGQKPLTFVRQLLSCCIDTSHLSSDRYPSDVRERAHSILSETGGYSLGLYIVSILICSFFLSRLLHRFTRYFTDQEAH